MERPVHLIVRLPYDRPQNAPKEPAPVDWTPQKDQFLWDVLSRSRAPDSAGPDWPYLAEYLETPLPFLLYRAQVRYEEDLRGLRDFRDVKGTLALQLGDPAQAEHPTQPTPPQLHIPPVVEPHTLLMQRVLSGTPSNRSASGKTSVAPTPTRTVPPTSPPSLTMRGLLESTATLTQRPSMVPLSARPRLTPVLPRATGEEISESSLSSDDDEDEADAERAREDKAMIGQRLKDLEKLMSSEMLGFARQPVRNEASPLPSPGLPAPPPSRAFNGRAPLAPVLDASQDKGKQREISMHSSRVFGVNPGTPSGRVEHPRGRRAPSPLLVPNTAADPKPTPQKSHSQPQSQSASAYQSREVETRSYSQQPSSASSASESRSPPGSIPSINSESPRRSSASASASAAYQSRSPSAASSPPNGVGMVARPPVVVNRHVKKLSLDSTSRAGKAPVGQGTPGRASEKGGSSTHGSTPSSFSDISDMSMSGSALEDAYLSGVKGGAMSRLSSFTGSRFSGRNRQSNYRQ